MAATLAAGIHGDGFAGCGHVPGRRHSQERKPDGCSGAGFAESSAYGQLCVAGCGPSAPRRMQAVAAPDAESAGAGAAFAGGHGPVIDCRSSPEPHASCDEKEVDVRCQ